MRNAGTEKHPLGVQKEIVVKNAHTPSERCSVECKGPGAKQEFKKDCDLNVIMQRMAKTGMAPQNIREGDYVTQGPTELQAALNVVAEANTLFYSLPATVRAEVDHDPVKFMEWASNPNNAERAHELGIKLTTEAEEQYSSLSNPGAPATPIPEGDVQTSAPSSDKSEPPANV